MAPNRVQRRATKSSNKENVDSQARDGRVTSTNPVQSPQAKGRATDERAALKAEKALRKARKDREERLKKHEAIDTLEFPANSFVALRISSNKLRSLRYPVAERVWGVNSKSLGLSRDWIKRSQDPVTDTDNIGTASAGQVRHQSVQAERTVPDEKFQGVLPKSQQISPDKSLYTSTSFKTGQAPHNLFANDNFQFSSSQISNPQLSEDRLTHYHSEASSHLHLSGELKTSVCSSPPTKGIAVATPSKSVANKAELRYRSGYIVDQGSASHSSPVLKKSLIVKLKIPEGYKLTEDMAPVKDPHSVHGSLKDVVQNLFEVQTQVHGFVNETQPLLVDKMTELAHSLDNLQSLTSPIKSPNNPIHQTRIAPEIIDYVDDGRNPDIFTRDFVELVSRGNAVINGKQQAFRDFSQIFADALKNGIEDISEEVDLIMKNAGTKNEEAPKRERQEKGAGRS